MGYTVQSIPGGWAIEEGNVRMYLLHGLEWDLLIDTGLGGGDLRQLVSTLTGQPVRVLLTHSHFDHIGCAGQFSWIWGCRDEDWGPLASSGGVHPLEDGDTIPLLEGMLTVRHTPGHTPGSVSLLDPAHARIFSGDNISDRPVYQFLPGSDLTRYMESLKLLMALADGRGTFYTCHGAMMQDLSQAQALLACCQGIQDRTLFPRPFTTYSNEVRSLYQYESAQILFD